MAGTKKLLRLALLLSVSLALSACGMFSSTDPRFDPAELTDYTPAVAVATRWSASIGSGGGYGFIPQVVDNTVYAATPSGTVAALDVASGAGKWRIQTEKLAAGVGSDGKTTAVVNAFGEILAFDGQGRELWRAQASSAVNIPPAVGNGLVAVRTTDYRIQAFDAATGKLRWDVQRPGPALSLRTSIRMLMMPGLLVSGMPNGRIMLIDTDTGAVRWEASIATSLGASDLERIADVVGEPVVHGQQLCGVSYQGRTTCFDIAQGGRALWGAEVGSATGMVADQQNLYMPDERDRVRALGLADGSAVWTQTALLNRRLSTPAISGSVVALGDYQGYVHFLARSDGSLRARLQVGGGPIQSAPQGTRHGILVQTGDGRLLMVSVGG